MSLANNWYFYIDGNDYFTLSIQSRSSVNHTDHILMVLS